MTDGRLNDAREDARSAIERYDRLNRDERMNDRVLKERAIEMRAALESLVAATSGHFGGEAPEPIRERWEAAERALRDFDDPTRYDRAQEVRRACYVLRKEAKSLLSELDEVGA